MKKLQCLACGGRISVVQNSSYDILGACSDCGSVLLRDKTSAIAISWCGCNKPSQEIFYFRKNGKHGFICSQCLQITQVG